MKRFCLYLMLFLAISETIQAQRVYFVYLQSDNNLPFFVKMNDKISSSTASGYLIMPKLVDSTYQFIIGFAQSKFPEQKFTVSINKKDHGYLMKNFGDKGWGLFDLQSMATIMSSTTVVGKSSANENKEVTEFTNILSKASGDPSLMEKQEALKVEPKIESAVSKVDKKEPSVSKSDKNDESVLKAEKKEPAVSKADKKEEPNVVATKKQEPAPVKKQKEEVAIQPKVIEKDKVEEKPKVKAESEKLDNNNTAAEKKDATTEGKEISKEVAEKEVVPVLEKKYSPSTVARRYETSTMGGLGVVYVDDYGSGYRDTISIFIPEQRTPVAIVDNTNQKEKQFIEVQDINNKSQSATVADGNDKSTTNSNCKTVADETDFFVLRKRMAAESNDDRMLAEAAGYYLLKCFTTDQIKNLSSLFLKDEGKYRFFDISYPHVADIQNFASLQASLKEEYYINRFKAMLRN